MKQVKSATTRDQIRVDRRDTNKQILFSSFSSGRHSVRARIAASAMGFLIAGVAFCLTGCSGFTVNKLVQTSTSSAGLSSLTCSKSSMTGAGSLSCTVTLNEAATGSGVTLALSSSSTAVKVPQSVTVPANATSATFSATISAVNSSESVTLTGTLDEVSSTFALQLNATAADLTTNSSSINFGNVQLNSSATQSITLTSSGSAALTINSVSVSGSSFSIGGLNFPLSLSPGQTATLNVQFDPTSATSYSGQVTISSNSSSNSTLPVALKGAGVANSTTVSYQVSLTWSAPTSSSDAVAGYKIYRTLSGSSSYQLLNSSVESQTAFTDSNVATGDTYLYYVTSVDSAGTESTASNVATVAIP